MTVIKPDHDDGHAVTEIKTMPAPMSDLLLAGGFFHSGRGATPDCQRNLHRHMATKSELYRAGTMSAC
jgi:hypothetical protein